MSNELATVETQSSAIAPVDMFSDARLKLIRNTVAKGAPDNVFMAMIDIARSRNLDPLAKQISVIKFKDDWAILTTIDGYRSIAADSQEFAGKDRPEWGPVAGRTKNGIDYPEWCSVTVYRWLHGQRMPFTAEVYWDEYNGNNFTWNKMPRTMLAKVAESHALRMAFSRSLSGIYTMEEMDQAAYETTGRVIDGTTGEIAPSQPHRQQAPKAIADPVNEAKAKVWDLVANSYKWGESREETKAILESVAKELTGDDLGTMNADELEQLHRQLVTMDPDARQAIAQGAPVQSVLV